MHGRGDGGLALSPEADLARRAAARLGHPKFEELVARSGMRARDLVRLAVAWQARGAEGVEVLGPPHPVPGEAVEEARAALGVAGPVRVQGNRVSRPGVQLRLGASGRWYRFEG